MDQLEQEPQAPGTEPDEATAEDDTEGHSMLTLELGRSVVAERQRQAADAVRDAGRARDAREHRPGGGRSLRDRLLGR